jgi:hypothetical protein
MNAIENELALKNQDKENVGKNKYFVKEFKKP